jgi:glycosyltransferase involved in cell wall biosynthesis
MISSVAQRVSVIVPCHNDGAYLAEALNSILSQSRPADEIVVIDDGSDDETDEVARRFAAQVRYVSQPHRGIGSARNTGLRHARGEFVAFLDADDVWPPCSLDIRMKQLESKPDIDAALGKTEEFLSPEFRDPAHAERIARGPAVARLAGAMVVRRRVFEQAGGFNEALAVGEWIDWVDRFNHAGYQIAALPELALRRRIHAGNALGRTPDSWGDYLTVLKAALNRKAAPPENAG